MAARPQPSAVELVDLRSLDPGSLDLLLAEESEQWLTHLDWDFDTSAELVRRFVNLKGLNGKALKVGANIVGYSYFVAEGDKGLIGNLFVSPAYASTELENRLLGAVVDELVGQWATKRIECQLLLLDFPRRLPQTQTKPASVFDRKFMVMPTLGIPLKPRSMPAGIVIEPFTNRHQEDASRLIAESYVGHVDASINDQYRSIPGARRFLRNIVQFPGCGSFCESSSLVAIDQSTGRLVGLSLASLVSSDVGHITQVCVSPRVRGTGVGYEILRRSIDLLNKGGCRRVSLTVTSNNRGAVALYERMGFIETRKFCAMVWEHRPSWFRGRMFR